MKKSGFFSRSFCQPGKTAEAAKAGPELQNKDKSRQIMTGMKESPMVRGKKSLIAGAIILAGLGLTTSAQANFPPVKIIPPSGTNTQKEVDPPPPTKVPCDPPVVHRSPEPGTMALAVIGAGTIAAWKRRRNKKQV